MAANSGISSPSSYPKGPTLIRTAISTALALLLVAGSAATAHAALYDQTDGPDIVSTVPSTVTLEPSETTYTLDVAHAFEKRYDVSYPRYVSTINDRTTTWANLPPGKHTISQTFEFDKYESASADCYVRIWMNGYKELSSSVYWIECHTPWGEIETSGSYSWYEYPSMMTSYGMVGHQFPVRSSLPEPRRGLHLFVPHDIKLSQGKTFTGRLVSQSDSKATTLQLTRTVMVQHKLGSATPKISNTKPVVGQTLTLTVGNWTSGTQFTYQWFADGDAINGATGTTLAVGPAQIGKKITVTVTGTKPGHTRVSKTSAATKATAAAKLKAAAPKIAGTKKVGKTLVAKPGSWTAGTSFTYQWFADGKPIKGAIAKSLKLAKAQKSKRITIRVTGSKPGYTTVTKTSAKTAKVK